GPMRIRPVAVTAVVLILAGCTGGRGGAPAPGALADDDLPRGERLRHLLGVLAADSLEGRRTGTAGSAAAAHFIASELERYGVEPGGDDGYMQEVVLVRTETTGGRTRTGLLPAEADPDTVAEERLVRDRNVVGLIPGADPTLREEAVVLGAHFDHVGIGRPVDGDSIYNGADDDASGTVAVLEVARALARGEAPARTVIVLLTTAEEMGILGTRRFVEDPVVPLERIVADLQVEMIGRPDSLAGGSGRAWLTGYERSTMGDLLREAGSPIVADPRPEQNFFARSDNIVFAREGIPAHTVSSFNLHDDYHRPSDEIEHVDFEHMTAVVDAIEAMVRSLASGPRPRWHPGRRPGGP
ncbi:MAG TPA: M20/M25/M40 family metallo-hydrolase, partial [Longimicrobiales bacterium]|nr:M20/M25/M40 family metallo-hydrolase [Longimicrobiales bacterium]